MKIYYWPDGTWCDEDEIHDMTHMSDDYGVFNLTPDDDPAKVDEMVMEIIANG